MLLSKERRDALKNSLVTFDDSSEVYIRVEALRALIKDSEELDTVKEAILKHFIKCEA